MAETQARPRFEPDTDGTKFGPFWLSKGISRGNAITLLFGGFSFICFQAFIAFVQPAFFEVLGVPEGEQGSLTGLLTVVHEITFILLVSLAGAISDSIGRRIVFVTGVLVIAVAYIVYPLAGGTVELMLVRVLFAAGFAAGSVMMHTCFAEYSQEATRGKWMGLVGFCNGLGVTFMALVFAKTPKWYGGLGLDDLEAIRFSFWTFSLCFVVLAIILRFGLKGHTQPITKTESLIVTLRKGIGEAQKNRRVALAYFMAFASRGDLAILTAFFSLWAVQSGTAAGLSLGEATAKGAMLFGLAQLVGLLWAFFMGLIIDKVHRLTGMAIAFGLAVVGYTALGVFGDPTSFITMLPLCVIVGMGESSVMVAGGVLIGQEAPPTHRGVVLGTFSLMGGIGIMVLSGTAGYIFDAIGSGAPFVMMGFINLLVLLAIFYVRYREDNEALTNKPTEAKQSGY